MRKVFLCLMVLFFSFIVSGIPAIHGEDKFPNKPITILVGRSAGGSTDMVARTLEPFLNKELKVPIVVQNQPGAGGDIANTNLWRSAPDGYTLIMSALPSDTIRQIITGQKNFDILKMTFIYGIAGGDFNVIIVPYDSPIKNFNDLKRVASEKTLTAGGTTPGSNSWYAYTLLSEHTGLKFKYVPYNSGTEAAMATLGGHVDLGVTSVISAAKPVQNKQLRIIAGFAPKHDPEYPDVKMMVELGYKDLYFATRQGLLGPPGMKKEIVNILAKAVARAVKDPKFIDLAKKQGFTVDPVDSEEFRKETIEGAETARAILQKIGAIKAKIK